MPVWRAPGFAVLVLQPIVDRARPKLSYILQGPVPGRPGGRFYARRSLESHLHWPTMSPLFSAWSPPTCILAPSFPMTALSFPTCRGVCLSCERPLPHFGTASCIIRTCCAPKSATFSWNGFFRDTCMEPAWGPSGPNARVKRLLRPVSAQCDCLCARSLESPQKASPMLKSRPHLTFRSRWSISTLPGFGRSRRS